MATAAAAAAAAETVLYSYWRSSCSYRVRIVLNLKGIPYKYHAVHLLKDGGQQLTEEYAALNPMREVPTLLIDGATLTQSMAICEYLEETRPSPALLPVDAPVRRAAVRSLCAAIACDIQPVGNLRILKHVAQIAEGSKEEKEAKKLEWAKLYIAKGFEGVEALLRQWAGSCCVGDEPTLADAFLVPQVYNAIRFNVDMTAYPTISRVHAHVSELPAFKAAHPSAQPDAEA